MFVGVVVENFHRCRAEQEKEERARRAAKRAKKIEERRRSKICFRELHLLCQVQKLLCLFFLETTLEYLISVLKYESKGVIPFTC